MHLCNKRFGPGPVGLTVVLLLTVAQAIGAVQSGDSLKHRARTLRNSANIIESAGRDGSNAGERPSSSDADLKTAFNYTALECNGYEIIYSQIERDLEIHRKLGGVSLESTRYFSARYGGTALRGVTIGFFGGHAYLLNPTSVSELVRGLSHHGPLHVAYLRMLLHLESCFGRAIPDVVFVLTTSDTPRYVSPLVVNTSSPRSVWPKYGQGLVPGPYPVCGIGKSDYFPDLLLIPNFHFHMKLYDKILLSNVPNFEKMPWKDRKPVLFGRFSHYRTNRVSEDMFTYKAGVKGRRICYNGNRTCPIRNHFIAKVVPQDPNRLDVSFAGLIPMERHSHYKYLLTLDGQGISSRLEQLLPMGSLVFKQTSGYYAYYYRSLLKHRVNIIEFWRDGEGDGTGGGGPEDVFKELDWVAENDEVAAAIAAEGQRIAATYLTGTGRTCYWYRLLHGLRSVLSYTPSLSHWPNARPLRRLIQEELPATPGGKELYDMPWAP